MPWRAQLTVYPLRIGVKIADPVPWEGNPKMHRRRLSWGFAPAACGRGTSCEQGRCVPDTPAPGIELCKASKVR
jgi:hypothetical protein